MEATTEAREARADTTAVNSSAKSVMMSGFPTAERATTATTATANRTTETLKVMKRLSLKLMKRLSNKSTVNCPVTQLTLPQDTTDTVVRDPRDAERARATREEAVDTGKLSARPSTFLPQEREVREEREEKDTITHLRLFRSTLVLTAMKSAMEAREEKEDSTTVDTTEERVERDTVVARLSATRLSVILLLTAMVTTAVLTHAFTAEKEGE